MSLLRTIEYFDVYTGDSKEIEGKLEQFLKTNLVRIDSANFMEPEAYGIPKNLVLACLCNAKGWEGRQNKN